jgi:hypothetical protein
MKKLELIPYVFWLLTAVFAFSCNVLMTGISAFLLIAIEVALCYVQLNKKY